MAGPRLHLDATVRGFDGLDAIPFLLEDVRVLPERGGGGAAKAEGRAPGGGAGPPATTPRPPAEPLTRRILGGKPFPRINTLVDAYNLASVETRIALAAFDAAHLPRGLVMRRARPG